MTFKESLAKRLAEFERYEIAEDGRGMDSYENGAYVDYDAVVQAFGMIQQDVEQDPIRADMLKVFGAILFMDPYEPLGGECINEIEVLIARAKGRS